jgi:hypothetical protein
MLSDKERVKNVMISLNNFSRRVINTDSWIREIWASPNLFAAYDTLAFTDFLPCLLLRASTLRTLILGPSSFVSTPLFAIPARICAESLRKLCVGIDNDTLIGDPILSINSFKRLTELYVDSYADWSLAPGPLILPQLTDLAWLMFPRENRGGSANEYAFLARCQFGGLKRVFLKRDEPVVDERAQAGFVGRFLA